MAFTDYFWTSPYTGNVIVECWGAGGGGRIGQNIPISGGGGGGAAYARKAGIALISGNVYLVRIADPTPPNAPGDTTMFVNYALVSAVGGGGAPFGGHGLGGAAGSSVGDVVFSGGDGGGDPAGVAEPGFGGGSSASDYGNGVAGTHPQPGIALARQGYGGIGGNVDAGGTGGLGPGGGGGGGGAAVMVVQTAGGGGGGGALGIWEDHGIWPPPYNVIPIATFGDNFPPTPPDPAKARKRANYM